MKVFVVIEMEVSDSSSQLTESQARQIAFDEISSKVLTQKKTGRPASGPKASVSGITVESTFRKGFPISGDVKRVRGMVPYEPTDEPLNCVSSTVEFDEHTNGRD